MCFKTLAMKINFTIQQNQITKTNLQSRKFATTPLKYEKDSFSFGASSQTRAKNITEDTEKYKAKLQTNPEVAFLYDPKLTVKEKEQMASEKPYLESTFSLAKTLGLKSYLPVVKWMNEGKLDYDLIPRTLLSSGYIDTQTEQNSDFINQIQEKLPHCTSPKQMQFDFNITDGALIRMLQEGDLKPLEATYKRGETIDSFIFDLEDETNSATLSEHTKLNPVPSEKYYKKRVTDGNIKPIYVPVTYLARLGYSSAVNLAQMLKTGALPGIYEKVQTPQGPKIRAIVDIAPYSESEMKLNAIRNGSKNIISTSDLAKKLNIRKSEIDEALKNGELEIIKEYIFPDDAKKVLVNLADNKTKDFADKKIFENKILQEQRRRNAKTKRAENARAYAPVYSLRMEIVWALCPNTRIAASKEAQNDGRLCRIIAKDTNAEELTEKEEIALNSYRKRYWQSAGTQEYEAAHKKAKEYMEIYKTQGIEAIDDPRIKAIIERFKSTQQS